MQDRLFRQHDLDSTKSGWVRLERSRKYRSKSWNVPSGFVRASASQDALQVQAPVPWGTSLGDACRSHLGGRATRFALQGRSLNVEAIESQASAGFRRRVPEQSAGTNRAITVRHSDTQSGLLPPNRHHSSLEPWPQENDHAPDWPLAWVPQPLLLRQARGGCLSRQAGA